MVELENNDNTVAWVMLLLFTCIWPKLIEIFGCSWQWPRLWGEDSDGDKSWHSLIYEIWWGSSMNSYSCTMQMIHYINKTEVYRSWAVHFIFNHFFKKQKVNIAVICLQDLLIPNPAKFLPLWEVAIQLWHPS